MQASELYRENEELIEHLIREGREEDAQLKVQGTYATNRFTQLAALARKFRLAYWRSPSYNLTRMLMTLLICLFYGTVFWGRGRLPAEGESLAQVARLPDRDWILSESPGWRSASPGAKLACVLASRAPSIAAPAMAQHSLRMQAHKLSCSVMLAHSQP